MEMLDIWDARVGGSLVEVEELVVEVWDVVALMDGRLSLREISEVVARVTIFIPLLVLVLAGIKRVVWLLDAGMAMR